MPEQSVKFQLNKLVRDKIPENMIEMGQKPDILVLEGNEKTMALIAKVAEELKELDPNDDSYLKELADVKQAVLDLIDNSADPEEVEKLRLADLEKRGGLKEGYFIESLVVAANSPWVDYYRKDPIKYPES